MLIYKKYTLDELNFIQKLVTPTHRWRKCARKTLGVHDWICKVALSSEVIRQCGCSRWILVRPLTP